MEKEPITSQGLEKIKKELEELKKIKRPKIIKAIAEARAHGDLKENAEYHASREQQAQTESKIIELNDIIARANVIDVTKLDRSDKVVFGSTVEVVELENNVKKIYKIVGYRTLLGLHLKLTLHQNFLLVSIPWINNLWGSLVNLH